MSCLPRHPNPYSACSLCRFYILSGIRIKSITLKLSASTSTTAQIFGDLNFYSKTSSPNHKYTSSNRIWDDTLFWNSFMRLLLRSIVLDNSVHFKYDENLSKIVAGVNSHKKLRKSRYHSESVILPINNGLESITLS